MTTDYQAELGARLRSIRQQQGMTLSEVEEKSDGVWKAVVVGSYERADRAISIAKLERLARFYGVPLRDLLPEPVSVREDEEDGERPRRVVLDLTQLEEANDLDSVRMVRRFAERIQIQRGDFNGRVLTIRGSDLDALAMASGADPVQLIEYLEERGALAEAS